MTFIHRFDSVNKTIHPSDALAPVYKVQHSIDEYFHSALRQVDTLEALSAAHLKKSLSDLHGIADYACHYGRLIRALRVAAPDSDIVACDIDTEALAFCAREFKARPLMTGWSSIPGDLPQVDLLACISLFTHTRKAFFEETLELWGRMVRPGGMLLFTYLGDGFIDSFEAGNLTHYGHIETSDATALVNSFHAEGHAFHGYQTPYSQTEYGVGFLSTETIKSSIAKSNNFVLLDLRQGPSNEFGQDVAVAKRRLL